MKTCSKILNSLIFGTLLLSGVTLSSCNEDITIGDINEENYITNDIAEGYLLDSNGKRAITNVEFRTEDSTILVLNATKKVGATSEVIVNYDKETLESYNESQKSKYELFPENLVSISNEGLLTIEKGNRVSNKINVKYKSNGELDTNKSYVIPLKLTKKSGDVQLKTEEEHYLIFVKDFTGIPDCNKSTGIKIISCMEVNDTNPLNNLCFTLKKSGKPLIDMLIIFSANINYNAETGKVYIYNNENVQHLLSHREKYLKPLKDRGMKIVLGLLGNHDRSGVANLAPKTAKAFAQEAKATCEAYDLDGVFFDDEYSDYKYPAPEGFVSPSSAAASRLCYEIKQAMPEGLVCAYAYSSTRSLPDVDGHQSGTFVDYGIHDYRNGYDLSSNYPGMPKSGMALYSQEFNRGYFVSESSLKELRDNGYGAHMIFAMDPNRSNFRYSQKPALESIAKVLFDDELVYTEKPYKKDW